MSNLIFKNYKIIISVVLIIISIPILPVLVEIIFKLGNIVGTYIRNFGNNGICF